MLQCPWSRSFDDDVRFVDQRHKRSATAAGREVDGHAPLPCVDEIEEQWISGPGAVRSGRALGLRHIRPMQLQDVRAQRPCPERREIEHTDVGDIDAAAGPDIDGPNGRVVDRRATDLTECSHGHAQQRPLLDPVRSRL